MLHSSCSIFILVKSQSTHRMKKQKVERCSRILKGQNSILYKIEDNTQKLGPEFSTYWQLSGGSSCWDLSSYWKTRQQSHDSTGQWAYLQLSSFKTVPKKIPKDRVQLCGVLFKPFSHTNEIDHKNEHSLTIAKQIKSSTSLHFARSYTRLNDDK